MTYFIVNWLEYDMPGGLLGKFIPSHLIPILGQPVTRIKLFSDRKEAVRLLKTLQQFNVPKLFEGEGLRLSEKEVSFKVNMILEDEVIET